LPHHELVSGATPSQAREDTLPRDLWHLFESYMHTTSGRTGKRWKDWLFDKASADENVSLLVSLEKNASCCIRTAVNGFAAKETQKNTLSIETLLGEAESLFPDDVDTSGPDELAAEREMERIAVTEAAAFHEQMTEAERVALAIKVMGIPVTDPVPQQITGWKKQQLNAAQHRAVRNFASHLAAGWSFHDPREMDDLLRRAVPGLARLCLARLSPEIRRSLGLLDM